jgi:hypothetical protein
MYPFCTKYYQFSIGSLLAARVSATLRGRASAHASGLSELPLEILFERAAYIRIEPSWMPSILQVISGGDQKLSKIEASIYMRFLFYTD